MNLKENNLISKEENCSQQSHRVYAGFWVRAFADCIDSLLLDTLACFLAFIFFGLVFILGLVGRHQVDRGFFESFSFFWAQIFIFAARGILSLVYYGWGTYRYGTTVGKQCLRLQVISTCSSLLTLRQSWIRCFTYLVSYAIGGAGFLMVIFHPEKRALHDWISGTAVISKPRSVK